MQKQTSPYLYRTAGPPSSSRICTPRAGCRSRGHIQDEARIHHRNRPASHSCICCDTKHDYKFKPALSLHFLLPRRKQTSNCDDHGIPNVFRARSLIFNIEYIKIPLASHSKTSQIKNTFIILQRLCVFYEGGKVALI